MKFHINQLQRPSSVVALIVAAFVLSVSTNLAAEIPKSLAPYFKANKSVTGEVGTVMPPEEINKYITKVQEAAKADPEWYKAYMSSAKPGIPLPWDEKIGLTQEEYDKYLALWEQREFKVLHEVVLNLEEVKKGQWMIRVSGAGMAVSLLRYNTEPDSFQSPNGELKRIDDVDADATTILGAWKGKEWKYEKSTDLVSTKENFALGKFADGKHCLLIYRLQENASGYRLADKSVVIRFAPPKK